MKIFDTHAHYDSRQFDEDRDELIKAVCIKAEGRVPVERIVNVGADMESSRSSLKLALKYEHVYAAVGVHPDSAGELAESLNGYEGDGSSLTGIKDDQKTECLKNREKLKELALEKKVVAIGEIGLDYHWNVWPKEVQKETFVWQWELAKSLGLPVIIHSRDAAGDTLEIVKDIYREKKEPLRAVMHCYSYSTEHAEEYMKMGLYFGIGGVVTFKNAKKLKEVVDMLPMERILLETDCPYMAPDPFRGKRNHSGYIKYAAEEIARIKGTDVSRIYDAAWENAVRFFETK